MGENGPIPKPTLLKIAEGNRGKRKLDPDSEPSPPSGAPEKPEHLEGLASVEWDRMIAIIDSMGILAKTDGQMIELYCMEYETYRQCKKDLRANGSLYQDISTGEDSPTKLLSHPAVIIMDKAGKTMARILAEFGLSPSSRSRVKVVKKKEKKSKFDDM